jgi:hypothetical protein
MGMHGTTAKLRIPYPVSGDVPEGADFATEWGIAENYLRGALLGQGGTRSFTEGSWATTVGAGNVVTVTVTGSPAVQGIVASALVEVFGTLTWGPLAAGSVYYLSVQTNPDIPRNPGSVVPVVTGTPPTGTNQLYLARLDATTPGTPSLDTNPAGKPTGANLFSLLSSPVNPFGGSLRQSNLTVTGFLTVDLGATGTAAFNQGSTTATRAALTVQQASPNLPHIQGTGELRLGDARVAPGGIPLSDSANTTLPPGSTSLLGGIALASATFPVVVPLTDAPTIVTDATLGGLFGVTLGGNRTLGNPTGGRDGQVVVWRLRQDGTGSRTLTLGGQFRTTALVPAVTLSTTPGSVDYLMARYVSADTKWDLVGFVAHEGAGSSSSGTVTSVSVTVPGGFTATVGTPTTTPAIHVTTTLSGILKGDGAGTIAQAILGIDYIKQNQTITCSGDATGSGTTSIPLTLATTGTPGTYTKVQTDTAGRVISGTTLTGTDIPVFVASGGSHARGGVPDPGSSAGSTRYLREDATWAIPAGGGGGGSGTVTSVDLTVPSWLAVSGNPITGSGTLAVVADTSQTANLILATPDNMTGAVTPRALVTRDFPNAGTAGTYTKVTTDVKGRVTSGTTLGGGDVPVFGASGSGHSLGGVPDPGSSAGTTRFLREDATWVATGTVTSVALTAPAWLTVSGSPVTGSGTLGLAVTGGQAANQFLGTPDGSTGGLGLRPLVVGDLPMVGVRLDSHYGTIITVTDPGTGTIPFNFSNSDKQLTTLTGNRTLSITGGYDGQTTILILKQDTTGSRTVTWWSGITWPGGVVPTLSTAVGKIDVFTFLRTATGAYLGLVGGQNY